MLKGKRKHKSRYNYNSKCNCSKYSCWKAKKIQRIVDGILKWNERMCCFRKAHLIDLTLLPCPESGVSVFSSVKWHIELDAFMGPSKFRNLGLTAWGFLFIPTLGNVLTTSCWVFSAGCFEGKVQNGQQGQLIPVLVIYDATFCLGVRQSVLWVPAAGLAVLPDPLCKYKGGLLSRDLRSEFH